MNSLKNHNFNISGFDTDSLTINKYNGEEFTKEEINSLTIELNSLFPELIRWEFEFYIPKIIVVKSKNYILFDGKKIKTKGSSIRDQKKEPALREMIDEIINAFVYDKQETLVDIYHKYIREALNITDITRWSSKKTITEAIIKCKGWTQEDIQEKRLRKQEVDVWEAIKHHDDLQEGNKVWVYPAILDRKILTTIQKNGKIKEKEELIYGLKSIENWNNDEDKEHLILRVYDTVCIFENILDMTQFVDYTIKKNKHLLETL